jgi:Zinc carboxypeptidase
MTKRILIVIIISVLSASRCFSQVLSTDEKLRQAVSQFGQAEVSLFRPDEKSLEVLTLNTSVLSVKGNIVYISLSPLTVEWFISQKYNYQIIEKVSARNITTALNINQAMTWDSYPTYTQYDSIMQNFQKLNPSLCRLDTIGTSVEGKLVLALKISVNPDVDGDKPAVFYTSTMHGDETGGYILMLHLADYLISNYGIDSRVTDLLDNLEIWINPLANPDGTYRSGNTITTPTRFNANGYDLNRNFPDPFTPNTVKQKETLDMIKFMRKHKFVLSANFHSGSEVVNYPWDRWLSVLHADDSWFNSISRSYADTAHVYAGSAYMNFLDNGVTRGAVWYIVYGGRQDFTTWELHGREVTIELDDQYVTPAAQLTLLWQNNWHSLIGYLENALYGIHGTVRSVDIHSPLPAKVFISGHDKDSSQVYSDTLTGRFVRFLYPGSWNLTFSAKGYRDTTITAIVSSGESTEMLVEMSQLPSGIEPVNSTRHILVYPSPATDFIKAILPDKAAGPMNLRVINQAGAIVIDYNILVIPGEPVTISTGILASGMYNVVFTDSSSGSSYLGRFVVIK